MRRQMIAFFGLAALVVTLVVSVAPRAATSVQTSNAIDIAGLTKAAVNLPEQSFPAH